MAQQVSFRMNRVSIIHLDEQAESLGLNRSQYLNHIVMKAIYDDGFEFRYPPALMDKVSEGLALLLWTALSMDSEERDGVNELADEIRELLARVK